MDGKDYILISYNNEQRRMLYEVEMYSRQFLMFLSRTIPDYSSHGLDHSEHIIKNINNFIQNWNLSISEEESLLLYLAAWSHDIGCLVNRESHHKESVNLIDDGQIQDIIGGTNITCLKYLILSHRTRYDIDNVPEVYDKIRLRLICAVFRLMDACEICYTKCPAAVYRIIESKLNQTSKNIWIAHMNIQDLVFKDPNIQISVKNLSKCKIIIDDLKKEIETIEQTFSEYGVHIPVMMICSPDEDSGGE